jgi:septal ring factor EnvC (AmiA/AmiB activator)
MRFRITMLALLVGAGVAMTATAQRAPGAPTEGDIRASIARLEAQRVQLRSEVTRKDSEQRDLEQQLERVRRDRQVLEQRLASTDQQIRALEMSLLQAR